MWSFSGIATGKNEGKMKNEKEGTPFPLETVYLRLFAIGSGEMFRKRDGMSFTQRTQRSQRGVPPRWWGNVPEKTRNEFHAKDATIAKGCRSVGLPCSHFSFFIFHYAFP
jgi:hypothetical protein